jgi:tetratricopeptide (TPR) repeat protein
VLESDFPDIAEAQPEVLARHFTEAGLADQAVAYWRRAGERAVARSANLEAVTHFGRGIEVLTTLPESAERDEQELVLQVALVPPLWACRGFGSPEARQASRRAVDLCRRDTADKFIHFRALYGLAYAYLLPGDLRSARPLAEQLLDFAERVRDPELLAYAHFEMGCELFWPAEFVVAREYLERGITLYDPEGGISATSRHAFTARRTAMPSSVACSGFSAIQTRLCTAAGGPSKLPRRSLTPSAWSSLSVGEPHCINCVAKWRGRAA